MDTLISVGVSAAYLWSLWALVFTSAGEIGMEMSMSIDIGQADDSHHIYLEVASTVVALILAGRYFEARAKRRAGDALRALLDLGAKDVAILAADGTELRVLSSNSASATGSSCAQGRRLPRRTDHRRHIGDRSIARHR